MRLFLLSLLCTVADPPPQILLNACPFECCQFGKWTALGEVKLLEKPGSAATVATIPKGAKVTAITGEQHIVPLRIDVLRDHARFKKGDVIHLLGHVAECGLAYSLNGVGIEQTGTDDDCLDDVLPQDLTGCAGDSCWGRLSGPVHDHDVWWVKIRTKAGKQGWTRETEKFHGTDRCG
jgi:hypothetical protein